MDILKGHFKIDVNYYNEAMSCISCQQSIYALMARGRMQVFILSVGFIVAIPGTIVKI